MAYRRQHTHNPLNDRYIYLQVENLTSICQISNHDMSDFKPLDNTYFLILASQ